MFDLSRLDNSFKAYFPILRMRVSPRRHVLVALRKATGLGQKEFAAAVKIGESTLQKIELGTYPLRPRIAERIATYTGVDLNYLTRNDLGEPLLNWRGRPYHKGDFEVAQGRQMSRTLLGALDYKYVRRNMTATLLNIYDCARCAFVDQPDTWALFHQFVHRQFRLMDEIIEAAYDSPTRKYGFDFCRSITYLALISISPLEADLRIKLPYRAFCTSLRLSCRY